MHTLCFFGVYKLLRGVAECIATPPCSLVPPESRPARHLDSAQAPWRQDQREKATAGGGINKAFQMKYIVTQIMYQKKYINFLFF